VEPFKDAAVHSTSLP